MGSVEEARQTIQILTVERDYYKDFWTATHNYQSVISRFQVNTPVPPALATLTRSAASLPQFTQSQYPPSSYNLHPGSNAFPHLPSQGLEITPPQQQQHFIEQQLVQQYGEPALQQPPQSQGQGTNPTTLPSTGDQNSAIPDVNSPSQSPETSLSRKESIKPISAYFSTVRTTPSKSSSIAQEAPTQQLAHPLYLGNLTAGESFDN